VECEWAEEDEQEDEQEAGHELTHVTSSDWCHAFSHGWRRRISHAEAARSMCTRGGSPTSRTLTINGDDLVGEGPDRAS